MTLSRTAFIGVPSSAGGRQTGQEGAPASLREAGLLERLGAAGLDISDLGDLAPVHFRPDIAHPRKQNLPLVAEVARQVADKVDRALADDRTPIVVGGDCSLSLGVISGLLRHIDRLGLVYFDADLDLNTPETTPSGVFDGMVLSHALGGGAPELASLGPRTPMVSEADIVLFGYDVDSGSIDPYEIEVMSQSKMWRHPLAEVRDDPIAAAQAALGEIDANVDAVIVHFDVDVTSIPAVDVPHVGGLDLMSAFAALRVFVASMHCAAVVVTEFNAELDPDGSHAARIVEGLVGALSP